MAGLLFAGAAEAANLVADGNFNAPSGGAGFTTYSAGSSFGPWQVGTPAQDIGAGSVDLIGGYWQAPTAGGGSVDLDGNNPGTISQTLTLAKGTYDLTFDLSGNPDGGASAKTVDVSVGAGSGAFTYTTGANSHGMMNYQLETLPFTVATAGPVTLTFASADAANSPYGPVIGDVSIASAIPEPASWALMLTGVAGLGTTLRSRKRTATAVA
ncbi:MAG TPA: DUF642 domain-containing protein [Caulobacteraceae bacterium]|nr:DUF642 domain-containing protein [Caulobacteraceae bacterium]